MVEIKLQLPPDFLQGEERDGYYVSAKMKEVWAVELDLLAEFDRVCKKYDIKYHAEGGTLLGAVRHGGFIPWDDDIDVMMMRSEYDRLCQVADEFEHPYFFQTEDTDRGSLRGHAQLRNSLTTAVLKSEEKYHCSFNQGIFLDIFPWDAVVDDEVLYQKQFRQAEKAKHRYQWLQNMTDRYEPETQSGIKGHIKNQVHWWLTGPLKNMINYHKYYKKYEEICKRYNNMDTEIISQLGIDFDRKSFQRERKLYEELIEWDYEFLKIPIPATYDELLKLRYGDYMKFEIAPSMHGDVIFDTDKPYTEYLSGK